MKFLPQPPTGKAFIAATRPEAAIISTGLTGNKLPKLTTLKVLEQNKVFTLVTGKATGDDGNFHQSMHAFDNGFSPKAETTNHQQGRIVISVSKNGERYTVRTAAGVTITRSAKDSDNN